MRTIPKEQQPPHSGSKPAAAAPDDQADTQPVKFWNRARVLEFYGGSRPLHQSTLYRGIASGIYPKPVNVAPGSVRWIRSECEAFAQRMIAARDEPKLTPSGRGRPRRERIT